MVIKLDKEYEVKCTLGTIRDIEKTFNRPFLEIVQNITKMNTDDQIKLLYVGARRADADLTPERFLEQCEQHLGIGDLMELLEQYFYSLQYPGLSEREAQERIQKKMERSQAMQKQGSTGTK